MKEEQSSRRISNTYIHTYAYKTTKRKKKKGGKNICLIICNFIENEIKGSTKEKQIMIY